MPRPHKKITLDELGEKEKKINDTVTLLWNRSTMREIEEILSKYKDNKEWVEVISRLKLKIRKVVI